MSSSTGLRGRPVQGGTVSLEGQQSSVRSSDRSRTLRHLKQPETPMHRARLTLKLLHPQMERGSQLFSWDIVKENNMYMYF